MNYIGISLFILLFSFYIIRFYNIYECNGEFNDICSLIQSSTNNDQNNKCIKNGFGSCFWKFGIGSIFNDPWFMWETNYTGNWENNMKHGYGEYNSMSGIIYKGDWENDKRDGFGKFLLSNKESYLEGIWKNDILSCSKGKIYYNNITFIGNINNSYMHGSGHLYISLFNCTIFTRFINGSIYSDVGDITINSNIFNIISWKNIWEFGIFSHSTKVLSKQYDIEYEINDLICKNDNLSQNQKKEVEILIEIIENIKNFEQLFIINYYQITQQPYIF